jgi:transposase
MAAVTQVSHRTSDGRACYDKKIAQGKTPEEELRALKRKISGSICRHLKADAARAAAGGPGGNRGTALPPARPARTRTPALRTSHSRTCPHPAAPAPHHEEDGATHHEKNPRTV